MSDCDSCGPQVCVMCGAPYIGYGHNAQPVADGRCCDRCNQSVIARRLDLMTRLSRNDDVGN